MITSQIYGTKIQKINMIDTILKTIYDLFFGSFNKKLGLFSNHYNKAQPDLFINTVMFVLKSLFLFPETGV